MKKTKILFFILKSIMLSSFLLLIVPIDTIAVPSNTIGPNKEYNFLRSNNNVNLINPARDSVEVDGKYNFSLQLVNGNDETPTSGRENKGTEYFVKRATDKPPTVIPDTMSFDSNLAPKSKVFAFFKSDQEQYVYIRQAGFYMGKSIDIKLSIDTSGFKSVASVFRVVAPHYSEREEDATNIPINSVTRESDKLGNAFLYLGSTEGGEFSKNTKGSVDSAFSYNVNYPNSTDSVQYSYTFYETDEELKDLTDEIIQKKEPIAVTGLWNVDNANFVKRITDLNGFNDLTKYFVYKDPAESDINGILTNSNNVVFKEDTSKKLVFTGSFDAYPNYVYGRIGTSFTTLFENTTSLSYNATYGYQIERDPFSVNNKYQIKEYGSGNLGIKYSRSAIPRVAPTEPYVIGIRNTSKYNTDYYTDLQYDIRFGIGSNDLEKRNDALSVQTEVPEYYDIIANKVEVVNMITDKKLEVGKHYTVEIDPNNSSKAKIIFTDPKDADINDGYFRVSINAETNSKFKFSPDKYGYLNDPTSEDNGYMHFDLAEKATLTYSHNDSGNVNKTLTSKKIDERSIAKVNYEGIPLGEAKDGLTLLQGNSISDEYDNAASLVQDGFDKLVDTNNISRDTPVTASFISPIPDTTNLPVGTVVDVPIRLTTPLGVTKDIVVKLTIRSSKSLLNVEFRNEADELLSSVQKEYPINTPIDLTTISDVINELNKYTSNGEYTIDEKPNEQFILDNTNGTKVYRLKGQVIISSAPALFDFGDHKAKIDPIEQKQAINLGSQDPLTIKDRRANQSEGWTLYLRSTKEFTADDGTTLPEALRYRLDNTNYFTVTNDSEEVFKKTAGGDYNLSNDWTNDGAGLGIKIDVKDIKKLGTYSAEIEWILMPDLFNKPTTKSSTPGP